MINHNKWLVVGFITSPHGINGKIKVKFKQPGKESFIITFKGITNRDQAENLKGYKILVKFDDIPKLKKEEFHLTELVNLKVKILENATLQTIGEVINLENEKNNLLVIKLFKNNKEVLVPFVREIIPEVDIKNKFLIITPPSGLLEL